MNVCSNVNKTQLIFFVEISLCPIVLCVCVMHVKKVQRGEHDLKEQFLDAQLFKAMANGRKYLLAYCALS